MSTSLPLHYQTRRLFCRVGFFLACLLPTAAVLGWGIARRSASHRETICVQLERELALDVRADAVVHPRPGEIVAEGLLLLDRESGDQLLRAARAELRTSGGGRSIALAGARIQAASLPRLRTAVEGWLSRGTGSSQPLRLTASMVALDDTEHDGQAADVLVQTFDTDAGPQAQLEFRLGEASATAQPPVVRLTVTRDRRAAAPQTIWELDTGGGWLPCRLARRLAPWHDWLGPAARFRGTCDTWHAADGLDGRVRGELAGVDLARLVGRRYGHELHGEARVTLERLEFSRGRLIAVAGRVESGPGTVGYPLLASAASSLKLAWGRGVEPRDELVRFQRMAARFDLSAEGLRIAGDDAAGAILVDDQARTILGQPARQPQPVAALVPVLSPPAESFVPANGASGEILSWLPLEDPR